MSSVEKSKKGALHIGVNAHLLSLDEGYRSAGINWYIYNLLCHLPAADPSCAYTVFLADRRYTGVPGTELRYSRLPTHQPAVRILWEQTVQARAMHRAGVDLIHDPAFVGPMLNRSPFVVTVHDLSFLLYPRNFRAFNRLYLRSLTRLSVRKARRVLAVSESTKQDLVRCYGISPSKIDTVHNGVDASFHPLPADQVAAFRAERGLPNEFILFVGTLEPRKNVLTLIEAYAQLSRNRPPLMLVGGRGWLYDKVFARIESLDLSNEVHFVGYVPAEELPSWYSAATLFVYPSLYEGFGLPPLEAMACGTPVITSTASSLPEVVGQAGLLVEPTNTEALTVTMARALTDTDLRESMQAAGLLQAKNFSWQRAAAGTVVSYRQAMISEEGERRV
jgi:glycosyltransferase involved in cell wall biosynthesis